MLSRRGFPVVAVVLAIYSLLSSTEALQGYYGTKIGDLTQLHHGVSGSVYAVDARTLFLKNFNYDGEGPAAYFYVGNTRAPSNKGAHRLRDERGRAGVLRKYRNEDITLSLPEGKTLRDVRWFSIWCDDFSVNFGDVVIRNDLDFPRPTKIGQLAGVHDVGSDSIVIVDAQTLLIPNFNYDGEAPDAKFWVGRGVKPSSQGIRIPDENGKETPLRRYDKKTIVLTLPGDLTVFDIGHFGVWCEAFTVDFGHVRIPDQINVPPSLKMLGISPQSKLNCEVLLDDLAFEVRWAVAGESIVIQLVARLEDGEYMSFGVSPDQANSVMIGADVAVVWVDKSTGKGYAQDYYLDAKSQCSGSRGSCPDIRIKENSNSIRLLNAAMVNGYSIVTYQRPLRASDHLDLPITTNGSQAIVWAVGPLNQRYEVSYHSQVLKSNKLVDFGRQPYWNCPTPESDQQKPQENPQKLQSLEPNRRVDQMPRPKPPATARPPAKAGAWEIPPIQCYEPEDGVFYAQLGPTGGKQGYPAITGHVGWGISWYINGLLIPEINVVRGKTYTFVVEGGLDPDIPAKYHPFYITDDPVGGYEHQEEDARKNIRIFAGVHTGRNGQLIPDGVGRLCNWTPNPDGPSADSYPSFGAYQRSLTLKCDSGDPGIITWTPDADTPDTVYYQCFTHRYIGWRINVHDVCEVAAPSEIDEVYVEPSDEGINAQPSIRHESKLLPSDQFLQQHENFIHKNEKDLIKNHNMNPDQHEENFKLDLENDPEMSKIIEEGIRAAEDLEEKLKNNQTYGNHTIGEHPVTHIDVNHAGKPILGSSGLPVYLRPPNSGPMFRPVKLPMRRPIAVERRPINIRPTRPYSIPQPSMIISHYQKPMSPLMRPFMPKNKLPLKAIAPILLLGEPTEIKPFRKPPGPLPGQPPMELMMVKPMKTVPYMVPDVSPHLVMNMEKSKQTPITLPIRYTKRPVVKEPLNIKPVFKAPYDVHEAKTAPVETPASNIGFEPSSVVVESGFKPIYRRQGEVNAEYDDQLRHHGDMIQRRQDYDIDEAIESDALMIGSGEPQKQAFEPMFIPSPLDSMAMAQKSGELGQPRDQGKPQHLSGDLKQMNVEDGEDKMAMADDRVDAYYLPPVTQDVVKVYPEGSIVSYDGKAVLDVSLLNSPSNVRHEAIKSSSKTEQFIRDTPQFGPFRGEIPPISDYVAPDSHPIYGVRGANAVQPPVSVVSEYANPLVPGGINPQDNKDLSVKPISTKLSIVKPVEEEWEESRKKREAHHHPDHQGDSHDDGWHPKTGGSSVASVASMLSVFTPLLLLRRTL